MDGDTAVERVVRRFLDAVESRDPDAVAACFAPDATYANVPHPPVVGPAGVRGLFAPILGRAEHVHWEIVTACVAGHRGWLERVDRFRIDGREYAVECNGVVEVDGVRALITDFRDYTDLGVWRARLGDVLG
ncbi:nuclear transport factor 2 family protein [Pseudonocardia sp. KRD-169]|uniref:Nuclear transport factor 2 family protein n=1 Tax=Pseudonocardia abyssalis TaxID=2792008 RepID=A0ABS6UR51_9PSEU|nr:nuclear transport factor 2 family protein [Pseudonocardia abyssalis]MBW0134712.1 nuclear transport factor 2 family protein [Pseudonocardia abyssalis]